MTLSDYKKAKNIHLFGIGGIGVSALARAFKMQGKEVSGQDTGASPITEELTRLGIKVSIGQSISAVPKNINLIVFSSALPTREPKFMEKLKKLGIPMLSYAETLGIFSKEKYTIAVAGTHGKTTTTAMVAEALAGGKLDPTVIVGSLLKGAQSNFIGGKSRYFVVEADDYRRQFLSLEPQILVITNIGLDHLDYYKDISDIQSAFRSLAAKVPARGYVVANLGDALVRPVLTDTRAKIIDYREFAKKRIALPIPGAHNQENAAAALAVSHILGIPKQRAANSLAKFSGTWRRFDLLGKTKTGALVYDDYAHNPDKVRAAIAGFREAHPKSRLVVVFQPHLYSRTKTLLSEFSESFGGADEVFVTPIFAAREHPDPAVSSKILAERIKEKAGKGKLEKSAVSYASDVGVLTLRLKKELKKGDVVVTMGAGDIYELAHKLISK